MIIGLGSDLCNIERIQASLDRFGERFELRVFTEIERAKAQRRRLTRAATYAKRFAAKEAFSKAVGTGFRAGVYMKDIGVVNARSGAPTLALTGGAAARLDTMLPPGHEAIVHLTLTDDHPWAQAFVVIEARPVMTEANISESETPETSCSDPGKGDGKGDKVDWLAEARGLALMLLAVLAFPQLRRQALLHPV